MERQHIVCFEHSSLHFVCKCNNVTRVCVDDSLASVRVEQSIQLEGLPLDDAYTMRTVTSAIPAAQQRAQEMVGDASRMITITVMGEIECSSGASATGLKGVIEGILYSQVCQASLSLSIF